MNGVFGLPITVDWLWFSSMMTKMRLTAALAPLSLLCAEADATGIITAVAMAAAASTLGSLDLTRMNHLFSEHGWRLRPGRSTQPPSRPASALEPGSSNDIASRSPG